MSAPSTTRLPPLFSPRYAIPLAAFAGFLGLAIFIAIGHDFAFDERIVMLMRRPGDLATPVGPAWFREAMRDVTSLGSFVGLGYATVIATLALWLCGFRHIAAGLAANVLVATLASTVLKLLFGRERPDIVEHAALTFTSSFPSGHAFLSAVTLLSIAGFVGLASRREDIARLCLWLAWVMIVLIGASRVYLGVHWPTDVLAGWLLGTAWSSLAVAYFGRSVAKQDPATPVPAGSA